MSAGKTEKPPRIKGLVKRCRSFKEDILSRLARNRSLGKDDSSTNNGTSGGGSSSSRRRSPGHHQHHYHHHRHCSSNSEGTSPIPGCSCGDSANTSSSSHTHTPDPSPQVSITHRLKEAYLTLQFVESLIKKNCVDLLGGSSNVMLDLMGSLLSDVKKTSVSDSTTYQSVISQVKLVLSDFLTAIDILLLEGKFDNSIGNALAHREICFEKILETLQGIKNALDRLQNLINIKENGHSSTASTTTTGSTPSLLLHTPTIKLPNSTSKLDSLAKVDDVDSNPAPALSQPGPSKRPPLPPKLKQWKTKAAKSFDFPIELPPTSPISPLNYEFHQRNSHSHSHNTHHETSTTLTTTTTPFLLSQWLDTQQQSSCGGGEIPSGNGNGNSNSNIYHYATPPVNLAMRNHNHNSTSTDRDGWTDSTIYVAKSTSSHVSSTSNFKANNQIPDSTKLIPIGTISNEALHRKIRTMSDSFYAKNVGNGSEESLDRICLPLDSTDELEVVSQATTTSRSHCSQSLSLGSSMDNLLLVDSQSQHSGLSPNSTHRLSIQSPSSAGLCGYDPDVDGDVFIAEVAAAAAAASAAASTMENDKPPELPQKKTRQFILGETPSPSPGHHSSQSQRCPSPYDNVDHSTAEHEHDHDLATWHGETESTSHHSARQSFQQHKQFMSYSESRNTLVGVSTGSGGAEDRPPLPPKKKHSITAYVEFLHNFDASTHIHNHNHSSYSNVQINSSCKNHDVGNGGTGHSGYPRSGGPHCYPNRSYTHCGTYQHFSSFSSATTTRSNATSILAAAPCFSEEELENCTEDFSIQYKQIYGTSSFDSEESAPSLNNASIGITTTTTTTPTTGNNKTQPPPALPPKKGKIKHSVSEYDDSGGGIGSENCFLRQEQLSSSSSPPVAMANNNNKVLQSPTHSLPAALPTTALATTPRHGSSMDSPQLSLDEESPDLYLLDVTARLVPNESLTQGKVLDGPLVKGGEPNVLMVYAAMPELQDIKFREVFLLTYRTFSPPFDVICLLWKRFQYFESKPDRTSVMNRRSTLDLFVDVICSLTPMDLDDLTIGKIRSCVYHLVNIGEVHAALKARKGLLEKFEVRVKLLAPKAVPVSLAVSTEHTSLIRWGASTIAQQMTLLDADLFRQLEPAELLLWAREQQEDFCPALNNFTDHFNKVSYWARSKVLLCSSSRERNRTMKKLIEVMRKLRDYNNFNSLLAVLAALDSAPIRRLGFSKRLTEALKPHAVLTDSSGSFRTYRQALSESKPPCIPYLGLVLQDLTFVHIGNADFLPDGKVNWLKRWQQCVVLEPIRRFHKCNYGFSRNDALLTFLNNFDESLNDDDLWQLSEAIKPRGKT